MRNAKNIGTEKSAIASHVWNNNHRINKDPKLLFIYKNNNKILNFEIPGEKDLIRPPPEKCQIAMQQLEAPVGN